MCGVVSFIIRTDQWTLWYASLLDLKWIDDVQEHTSSNACKCVHTFGPWDFLKIILKKIYAKLDCFIFAIM